MNARSGVRRIPRLLELLLFVVALLWAEGARAIAGRASAGIANRLQLTYGKNLLDGLFLLFLVVIGFQALDFVATKSTYRDEVLALPRRPTAKREWTVGFAIGWALCLTTVLPALLLGHFHAGLNRGTGTLTAIFWALATIAVACLYEEVVFRGYPFLRLVHGLGPASASGLMSLVYAVVLVSANPPINVRLAVLDGFLFGVALAVCYLRTHGLWLGWGLHFGYRAIMAVVLGLPVTGWIADRSLLSGAVSGPEWLSGGAFGLDAAAWTALSMLGVLLVLYRISKDWAWEYTLPKIVSGGYEVVVAPPAAHAAMVETATPAALVQIMPATSKSFSTKDPLASPNKD